MNRKSELLIAAALVLAIVSCATPKRAVVPPARAAAAPSIVGDWNGAIVIGPQSLRIVVHFTASESGAVQGTIDIPQQSASGLPLSDLVLSGERVAFTLHAGSDVARFDGTRTGGEIEGTFAQGPARGIFKLQAGGAAAAQPPAESLGSPIELRTATGTLYGSLVLPTGEAPYPVALIISGSGPTDRNGNSPALAGPNDSLEKLAALLQRLGVASVRYDKRGVAQSARALVDPATLRFDTYVDDAVAWIRLLRADPRFGKLVVIGHSEGSLIGMIAARRAGADAFVSIAGAGAPADVVLRRQLAAQPQGIRDESYRIIDSLVQGRTVANVDPQLNALFRPSVQPYLISWFKYNPATEIAALKMPILIVQGTTDLQVGVDDARALKAAAPRARLLIVDGMNHVLVDAPADPQANVATYSNPKLPLAGGLAEGLTSFLRDAVGAAGG